MAEPTPQTITRTIPRAYNHSAMEWMPERQVTEQTGWWELRENGLHALGRTPEGARRMIATMRGARAPIEPEGERRGVDCTRPFCEDE